MTRQEALHLAYSVRVVYILNVSFISQAVANLKIVLYALRLCQHDKTAYLNFFNEQVT